MLHSTALALITPSAFAGDPEPTGAELLAKWQKRGAEVLLLTPERLAAFGPAWDPTEAQGHSDFVIELSLDPAPFCPHISPFDLWTKAGFFPWAPYLHGCGGPTEFTSIAAEGDHVDLVGDLAVPGSTGAARVRVKPLGGGRYTASWRHEVPADSAWSAPIALVEGKESTIRRLIRYRTEAAGPPLAAAGVPAGSSTVKVDGVEITIDRAKCQVGQWSCDPEQIAVACPAGKVWLRVLAGKLSVQPTLYTWEACTDGALPGIRAP